jgi:prephenate dehydrogenase
MTRPTVAVVGLGLVGGSLARALGRAGWPVLGVDRAAVLRRARRAHVIRRSATLEAAAAAADLVVLAAPPDANLKLLRRLVASGTKAVITDVGSVKAPICREAERLVARAFVGGHPMAGGERSGFGASSAELFVGRPWIVTTPASAAAARVVRSMVRGVGGRVVAMTPADHDRAVAFLSHVPQMASWALLEATLRDPVARRHLGIAGPGFKDMTRLAASPRRLWREILGQNRAEVRRALAALRRGLSRSPLI